MGGESVQADPELPLSAPRGQQRDADSNLETSLEKVVGARFLLGLPHFLLRDREKRPDRGPDPSGGESVSP